MEFCKSQTYLNLAKSFAGEAQAGLRYQFIADLCTQQGYKIVADEDQRSRQERSKPCKGIFQSYRRKRRKSEQHRDHRRLSFRGENHRRGIEVRGGSGKERGRENLSLVSEGCAVRRLYGDREIVRLDRGSRNFTRGKVQVSVRELSERNAL